MDNLNNKLSDEAQTQPSCLGAVSGSALSPVEWLEKEVKKRFGGETFTSVFSTEFEKAKQMEKELSSVS
jgi:hypothetical protein